MQAALLSVLACQEECASGLQAARGDAWLAPEPLESALFDLDELWEPLSDGLSAWDIAHMDEAAGEEKCSMISRAMLHACQRGKARAVEEILLTPAARVGIARVPLDHILVREPGYKLTAANVRAWSRFMQDAPAERTEEFLRHTLLYSARYLDDSNCRKHDSLALRNAGSDIEFPTPWWGLMQRLCADPRIRVLDVAVSVCSKHRYMLAASGIAVYQTAVQSGILLLALLATQQTDAVFGSIRCDNLNGWKSYAIGHAAPFFLTQTVRGGLCDMVERAVAEPVLTAGLMVEERICVLLAALFECPADVRKRMLEALLRALFRDAEDELERRLAAFLDNTFTAGAKSVPKKREALCTFLAAARKADVRFSSTFWLRVFLDALRNDAGWAVPWLLYDTASASRLRSAGALALVRGDETLPCNRRNCKSRAALRRVVLFVRKLGKNKLTAMFGGVCPEEHVFQRF